MSSQTEGSKTSATKDEHRVTKSAQLYLQRGRISYISYIVTILAVKKITAGDLNFSLWQAPEFGIKWFKSPGSKSAFPTCLL